MRGIRIPLLTLLPVALTAQVGLPLRPTPAAVGKAAPTVQEQSEDTLASPADPRAATTVTLLDPTELKKLDSVPGTIGRTWIYVATLLWADFPGTRALARTQAARPIFRVTMDRTPRNRLFLVRCQVNRRDATRSVKLGQAGVFTYKGINAPDQDWIIPTQVTEAAPGVWNLTPTEPLPPGEYGVFSGIAAAYATKGSPAGELFEFGIDAPKS